MASQIELEIVTPERRAYAEPVDSVVLPGSEGELGILPNHVPLLTLIKPGELRVLQSGVTHHLAVGEGVAEVTGRRVTVLVDIALKESEIDENKAEEALKRAEEALKSKEHTPEEAAALAATIQKSVAQLGVKRRRRG
jgi:F-type H+-transporting ATPase subunit epsilon